MNVVVYTTIFGGSDSLKPAPVGPYRCVCFVDNLSAYDNLSNGWELREWPTTNPRRDAWRLRCLPHELFKAYDRVIWVDASFTVTNVPMLLADAGKAHIAALRHHERKSCYEEGKRLVQVGQADAKAMARQLRAYRHVGFHPKHLSISCVIVRDRTKPTLRFNETWASEIERHRGDNTQVSLDYSAWLHGLKIVALEGNRHDNPYARHDHWDHRRRRKPYQVAA